MFARPRYDRFHPILSLSISADGRRAVSGGYGGTVRVWDLDSGAVVHALVGHRGKMTAVAVSADGRRAVSGGEDGTVRVWDLDSGAVMHALAGHADLVWAVAVTADGRRAVSCSTRTLRMWDLAHGAEIASFVSDSGIKAVATHSRPACV